MFLVSSRYLESLRSESFDYDLVRTATHGLHRGVMVPWTLPVEAEHEISIVEVATAPRGWNPVFFCVGPGDRVLLLPWATLTQIIEGDSPEARAGLVDVFDLPCGWYEVVVGEPAVLDSDDFEGDIRLETTLSLVKRSGPPAPADLLALEIPVRGGRLNLE